MDLPKAIEFSSRDAFCKNIARASTSSHVDLVKGTARFVQLCNINSSQQSPTTLIICQPSTTSAVQQHASYEIAQTYNTWYPLSTTQQPWGCQPALGMVPKDWLLCSCGLLSSASAGNNAIRTGCASTMLRVGGEASRAIPDNIFFHPASWLNVHGADHKPLMHPSWSKKGRFWPVLIIRGTMRRQAVSVDDTRCSFLHFCAARTVSASDPKKPAVFRHQRNRARTIWPKANHLRYGSGAWWTAVGRWGWVGGGHIPCRC